MSLAKQPPKSASMNESSNIKETKNKGLSSILIWQSVMTLSSSHFKL